jgi:hypothetical protein
MSDKNLPGDLLPGDQDTPTTGKQILRGLLYGSVGFAVVLLFYLIWAYFIFRWKPYRINEIVRKKYEAGAGIAKDQFIKIVDLKLEGHSYVSATAQVIHIRSLEVVRSEKIRYGIVTNPGPNDELVPGVLRDKKKILV